MYMVKTPKLNGRDDQIGLKQTKSNYVSPT